MKTNMIFIIITFLTVSVFADKELDIPPVEQDSGNWCWAACSKMVLDAYSTSSYSQQQIANYANGGVDGTLYLFGAEGSLKDVEDILYYFENISTIPTANPTGSGQGNLSEYDIIEQIDGPWGEYGRPIIANIAIDGDSGVYGHDVLIRGYYDDGYGNIDEIKFNDPASGVTTEKSYAEFVRSGDSWAWYETLRMQTSPPEPIPVGIGYDHRVEITSGTMEIYESTTSLSYDGEKYGDSPDIWEWKLVFPKANGDMEVVESWTTYNTSHNVTWNITGFSMPSYDWHYSGDGTVRGRIQVSVEDPDFHYDDVAVEYIPDETYPGIIKYHDKTVSSSKPDVKAHEYISLASDQFNSGADISFKSGDVIIIRDGVTFEDGSDVNFTVDVSYR